MISNKKVNLILKYAISLIISIFMIFPFALICINSVKDKVSIIKNPLKIVFSNALTNYFYAFNTMNFLNSIKNSTIITIGSLFLIILFSSMFAYYLVRWKWKINNILLFVMVVPFQTIMIPFVTIYGRLGLLNNKYTLMFFYLGFGLSMATFMYHGFIKSISTELEEASIIDGCGRLDVFFKIVFPLIKPITVTIIILDLLWIWNDYLLPSLVLVNEKQRTLPLSTFYFFGTYSTEFGYGMAALVMSIIPIIIIYALLQKQIIKGVMDGAIK
jgi:raffinose/stachyose/melibiose transport system permease protein